MTDRESPDNRRIEQEAREAAKKRYANHAVLSGTLDAVRNARLVAFEHGYVAGATRPGPPVTELTPVRIYSRSSGKTQAMIDALLAQANKLGISVEIIRPESPVTDAECVDIANRAQAQTGRSIWPRTVRAVLEAARATRKGSQS